MLHWRNYSTVTKISLVSVLVVSMVVVATTTGAYYFARKALLLEMDTRLLSHAEKVETKVKKYLDAVQDNPSLQRVLRYEELGDLVADDLHDLHVWVWDSAGNTVVADTIVSAEQSITAQHSNGNIFILKRLDRDTTCTIALDSVLFRAATYRLFQETYYFAGHGAYTVAAMASVRETEQGIVRIRAALIMIALVVPCITGIASYFAARNALRPITAMTKAAAQMSARNLQERLALPEAKDEVRALAETLNAMLARLKNSFEAQQHFIADAAHELRTPLTALRCELELAVQGILHKESDTDNAIAHKIHSSLEEIARLERLSDHLLTLARLDAALPLRLELVRIDEIIIECIQRITPLAAQKSIVLDLFIDEALEVQADLVYVRRALNNLAENAVAYAPEHTGVSMRLHRSKAQIDVSRAEEEVAVVVITNAGEIPDDERERIFERFYRGERHRSTASGSGLGLAIAREIIIRHGGKLSLETQGQTVICTILLPLRHFGV